jgi:hypothetical protein
MTLVFETRSEHVPAVANRADIACFIGHVARRPRSPLPAHVHAELRAAGWIGGPWRRSPRQLDSLEQLPVTVESWEAFDLLFDCRRPLAAGGSATSASYLGATVRRFFAEGGQRAVIVRVGDPWPVLESAETRAVDRPARIRRIVPGFAGSTDVTAGLQQGPAGLPFDATLPPTWCGLQHVYGLPDVSTVCLPDLADACATAPAPAVIEPRLVPAPESFVECSEAAPPAIDDLNLRRLRAPRCDANGLAAWSRAVSASRTFLVEHRRDCMLAAALPLTDAAIPDPPGFLERSGVLAPAGGVASAFVQLAYPWLRTRAAVDLPEGLEPPDGVLAGLIAVNALTRGTFRSVAGRRLPEVFDTEPRPAWGLGPQSPWARFAERICLIAPEPGGWAVQSDVTTSPHAAWRSGGASRMMASLLRAARLSGEAELFEANGPALWTRIRRTLEALLTAYWREGALGGSSAAEAFEVRCDRSTMTRNDLDAGRVKAEIAVLPVAAVERITVVLTLAAGGETRAHVGKVA